MELERGGLSEGEDCSAPGEDGGFRAYCLGTSSKPWSSGWGVYVCLCDRCIRFELGTVCALFLRSFNNVVAALKERLSMQAHCYTIFSEE